MIIRRLVWDEWNIEHIAKHSVRTEEIEDVCLGKRIIINKIGQQKVRVLGQTYVGRYLAIFLVNRGGGNFYPISARDCASKERRFLRRKLK